MCRSVPQIAVLWIRIMTSLWPTSGFFTRVSVNPGAGSSFASALIDASLGYGSSDHAQCPAHVGERRDGLTDLLRRVRRAHLRSYARSTLGHHGIRKADDVDAFGEQRIGHAGSKRGIAQHDRNDRMLARHELEAKRRHLAPEVLTVPAQAGAQPRAFV